MQHHAGRSAAARKCPVFVAAAWLLATFLVLGAGSAWAQAEQSEDDSDSRTQLYSGLVESSALRRSKLRLSRTSWAFTAVGSAAAVYDSNVFRGPDARSAGFGNLALGGIARRAFDSGGRLKIEAAGGASPYSRDSDVLNEYGAKAKAGYTHRFTDDLSARLYAAVKYSNDHATDIEGQPFVRSFENVSYRFGASSTHATGDWGVLRLSYDAKRKDYSNTALLPSLDWWRHRVGARQRFYLGDSAKIDLDYRFSVQDYDEEPSQDSSGLPDPTVEEHFFHHARVKGSWDIARWIEVSAGYRFKRKDDRFDDYESYDSHKLAFVAEMATSRDLSLEVGSTLEFRRYDNRLANLVAGETLEYDKYSFFVNGSYDISKNMAAWVGYHFTDRDSNRSFGTSFRSYSDHQIFAGLSVAY